MTYEYYELPTEASLENVALLASWWSLSLLEPYFDLLWDAYDMYIVNLAETSEILL
jgi:hypothetical protein